MMKLLVTTQSNKIIAPEYGFGVRHIQVLLVCFWNLLCFTMCNLMPTCIVAMTDPTASPNPNIPTFPNWTNQSIILSSFGWGYTLPQVFGGQYAKRYGAKWFFVGIMIVMVICNISLPLATVRFGSIGVIICGVIEGIAQGFGVAMIPEFINTWVPRSERTTLGNAIYAAYGPGCVFATNLAGSLSSSKWGWPSVFYLSGVIGIIWIICMLIFGENKPEQHKKIKMEELLLINYEKFADKEMSVPWRKILKSEPVWSLWIAHIGGQAIYWFCYVEFPTYLSRVFGFSVWSVGEILSAVYLISWLLSLVASSIIEYLINRSILETGDLRKISNSIASYGPGVCLIGLSYVNHHNTELALFLILLVFITLSTHPSGYMINYNDVAPNFCGLLYGIGGFISSIVSLIAVGITQVEVVDQSSRKEWAIVLWFCAIVVILSNVFYTIYASGEIQPWNSRNKETDNEEIPMLGKD